MNKKGVELAMNTIVIAVIVLIVAFIIIFVFQKYYGKETGFIGEKLEELKEDYDKDGTADFLDKCPCNGIVGDECKGEADPNKPDRSCLEK